MPIKIQNFLFLLGASYVVAIVCLLICSFCVAVFNWDEGILTAILFGIPNIAIAVGLINFCNGKLARYIYDKSTKYVPRLRWYSMFFAWLEVFAVFLFLMGWFSFLSLLNALLISCIVGALCFPKRSWEKRIISAVVFLAILMGLNF